MSTEIFETRESEVRAYCRTWPTVFTHARGSRMYAEDGRPYLDFFAGAGALNYGHAEPALKEALLDYVANDGVIHSLDMFTLAKRDFLETFDRVVLSPRGLDWKVMFPGPTGTNAVEAALKLARKVTGRTSVIAFTNAFHGVTLGALAVTASALSRGAAGVPLTHVIRAPYDGFEKSDSLARLFDDLGSGVDRPAAAIVETVQGEGGLHAAGREWLRRLNELCRRHHILLIVDDVQMGCGRTGPFFSHETLGIDPDIVCLSKSISGYGLPLALTLFRPELDLWKPGEHSGTFRGSNPAFVTGSAALRRYWQDDVLEREVADKGTHVAEALGQVVRERPDLRLDVRGRGLARGLVLPDGESARRVCGAAFERGLLVETCGSGGEVVKLMPPLTIDEGDLAEGLGILAKVVIELPQGVGSLTGDLLRPARNADRPGRRRAPTYSGLADRIVGGG